ncbi:MAG: prepilin-type N-terminal cleavage/methylation domain-containing protein [Armatimonadetes bacterium]|nr:prepilin-type N-terminal cleavage/methylation domain-containing protein [Armatimonadota bacterium]
MRKRRDSGFTLVEIMIVIAIMGALLGILLPSYTHAMAQGKLSACKSNLKNLSTAIETYRNDYGGQAPPMMRSLAPTYLAVLPTCPSRGETYSRSVSDDAPDSYVLFCRNWGHGELGLASNFPQYSPAVGMLEK